MNSDGHVSLFRPNLMPGQWWANRNPVGLFHIVSVNEDGIQGQLWDTLNPGNLWTFTEWPSCVSNHEYLWFEERFERRPDDTFYFGQFYVSVASERLFFIAPEDDPTITRILASWVVSEMAFRKSVLYQDIKLPRPQVRDPSFYERELLSEEL